MRRANKAVVIGLDAANPDWIRRFANEGKLPNIKRLMTNGVFARLQSTFPTVTPPAWASLATGSWPGTHGYTGVAIHKPGEPFEKKFYLGGKIIYDEVEDGFTSVHYTAEPIWKSMERTGKRAILIRYPTAWPPMTKRNIQVGGDAPRWGESSIEVSPSACYTTHDLTNATRIEFEPAGDWRNLPKSHSNPYESSFTISSKDEKASGRFFILLLDTAGRGYDKVMISPDRDAGMSICSLSTGQWSEWLEAELKGEEPRRCSFKFKLVELSPDAKAFKLFRTQAWPTKGWTVPDQLAAELTKKCGYYVDHAGRRPYLWGWIDLETYFELMEHNAYWLGRAGAYLMRNYKWNLFMLHYQWIDHVEHAFCGTVDQGHPDYDERKAVKYWKIFERIYRIADKMTGDLVKAAGPSSLVVVLSDHGCMPFRWAIYVNQALVESGLLALRRDPESGQEVIDWSRTRAYAYANWNCHIWVNLKGRDPEGIVEPGDMYERTRDQIIDTLQNLKDPRTGRKALSAVLKREQAEIFGLRGDRVGDLIYCPESGYATSSACGSDLPVFEKLPSLIEYFSGDHGHLPTDPSVHGFFVMAGPGVKKNYERSRLVKLVDVAPTIAYLTDIPVPKDAEGSVLYDSLC